MLKYVNIKGESDGKTTMEGSAYFFLVVMAGFVAAAIAGAKGRNVVVWFFLGFCFHIIAIVIVATLAGVGNGRNLREAAALDARRRQEQRRRYGPSSPGRGYDPSASFEEPDQRYADTADGGTTQYPNGDSRLESARRFDGPADSGPAAREWYYEVEGQTMGPVTEKRLLAMLRSGRIEGWTQLWTDELGQWCEDRQIPALEKFIGS